MIDHPYNEAGSYARLLHDYKKYGSIFIGFDFDNTIWDHDNYGGFYKDNKNAVHWSVVNLLKECKELGMKLCLWTCCATDEEEKLKADICAKCGIDPDYINWSPLSPGAKKPHFSILLDDRAGLETSYSTLRKLVDTIKSENS